MLSFEFESLQRLKLLSDEHDCSTVDIFHLKTPVEYNCSHICISKRILRTKNLFVINIYSKQELSSLSKIK